MSTLAELNNPPPINGADDPIFKDYLSTNFEFAKALEYISNTSIILTPDFNTLSAKGLTPTTQADGDNTEFIKNFFIVGASVATYSITPTVYAGNSTVKSASPYYFNFVVSAYTTGNFYFYQRQANTIRKYQENYFTYGMNIKNNSATTGALQFGIFSYYDTGNDLVLGDELPIEAGDNFLSATMLTKSLSGVTVGASPYTEFRVYIKSEGAINLDFFLLKNEFGIVTTPYYL